MRKSFSYLCTVLMLVAALSTSGCFTQEFVVGKGAQTGDMVEGRQWYVLWGLVPITEVDTQEMADGADDYTIETEFTALDYLIGLFTGLVSIQPKTTIVTK